jgi:TolB protein
MTKPGWIALAILSMNASLLPGASELGIFSGQTDIGNVLKPGSLDFNAAKGEYFIAGGGENIWSTNDSFHFVWEKMTGDFTLTADIGFVTTGGNPHRKAALVIRQSLAADSVYADVVVHGSGLTSLQYRDLAGQTTHEFQSDVSAPRRVRLEKRGDFISMWVAPDGGELKPSGENLRLPFPGDFYVGLGVCAHDNSTVEKVVFSNVELATVSSPAKNSPVVESTLETVEIATTNRRVVYHTRDHIEAPNWSRDGQYFLLNGGGNIFKLPVTGGTPEQLRIGEGIKCNNDHGISPDGAQLVVSGEAVPGYGSRIYVLPVAGGEARQVTPLVPSYWHGWSPDGQTLAYCAQRNGEFDIYTISVGGGLETRLTTTPGLDDGPDYSPDGKYIYFNSERTGLMQIWRMKADGSEQTQITFDDCNNWFAHPSPDGKWIVFLTYARDVKGHPANQDVTLRLMSLVEGNIRVLAKLFGGQGTINVPSWSPDSQKVAFVSYQPANP